MESRSSEVITLAFMTSKRLFGKENSTEPVISVTIRDQQNRQVHTAGVKFFVELKEVTWINI